MATKPNGFYDEGWNARVEGAPYDPTKSRAWRDGWKDCEDAGEPERVHMD